MRKATWLVATLVVAAPQATWGAMLSGRVTDSSGRPVAKAFVHEESGLGASFSAADGRFTLDASERGDSEVIIMALGYRLKRVKTSALRQVVLEPYPSVTPFVAAAPGSLSGHGSREFGLFEALMATFASHPTARAASASVMLAATAREAAGAERLPRMGLSATVEPALGRQVLVNDVLSVSSPGAPAPRLSVTQPVFTGFRLADLHAQADVTVKQAQSEVEATRVQLGYACAQSYMDALRSKAAVHAARNDIEESQGQLRVARLRRDAQVGTELDVLQAQAQLAAAESRLHQAEGAYRAARRRLDALSGGVGTGKELDVLVKPRAIAWKPEHLDAWLAFNPALRQSELAVDAATIAARQRSRNLWPTLDLTGQVAPAQLGGGAHAVLGASLNWNAFDGGRTTLAVRQAELERDRLEARHEASQLQFKAEAQSAKEEIDAALKRLDSTQNQLQSSGAALKLARMRYDAHAGTSVDVLQALGAYNAAQLAHLNARYDLYSARLHLGQALGIPAESLF